MADEVQGAEAELRRALDAAKAANAAKTRYLVAASHEIRSPLNAIYGYAQLLERGAAIPPAEAGAVIRRSSEHLSNLVEGLLDISRIESSVLSIRRDVVRLPALLDHVVDMFRTQAAAKGLALDYAVDGRLPAVVRTDEKRLRQILINLLSNAIKYTRAGGATLTVRYRSQTATITVVDTGIGIAEADMERIFEPFERVAAPDASMQPGLGLGLALTRALARLLGGEVTATSEPGHGSRFTLRLLLPEPMDAPQAVPASRPTGYRGARRTILAIDDDPAQLVVLRSTLEALGFIVETAGNGAEGLAIAARSAPDLAMLDVQMPGLGGWDVAARLREAHGPRLRIAIVSANAHEFRAGGNGGSDHDAFVSKPVELDGLIDTIGRLLDLDWTADDDGTPPAANQTAPLPAAARPYLDALARHVRTGHVRTIEAALVDLERMAPAGATVIAEMRRHLDAFDLRALARTIADAG